MQMRTYLAIGAWAVLGVAMAQLGNKNSQRRAYQPMTAEKRVDALQAGFQSALNDLSMNELHDTIIKDRDGKVTTVKMAQFGLARTPPAMIVHDGVMRNTNTPAQIGVEGGVVEFFAVSSLGKPLEAHKMTLHTDVGPFAFRATKQDTHAILAFAERARNAFAKKSSYSGTLLDCDAEARPLKLSKPECLPCHKESKVGDPLAILVCILKKNRA